jgi:hypothetical protein
MATFKVAARLGNGSVDPLQLNSPRGKPRIGVNSPEATMRPGLFGLIFASASCVLAASPAQAIMCYVVYDRGENIIYQSTYPPVDMSNAGTPDRDALRRRGEHLTFGDINQCKTVVFLAGGTSELNVDEVVAGVPAFSGKSPSGVAGRTQGTAPASRAPAAAPKARTGTY